MGSAQIEWVYRAKDGREVLTEAIATRVDLPERTVVLVEVRDIEREQQRRRDLSRAEALVATVVSHLEEGVLIVNDDTVVTYASASAAALLHLSRKTVLGQSMLMMSTPQYRTAMAEAVRRSRLEARSQPFRFALHDANAGSRWFAASCQHIDDPSSVRGHIILFHEITEWVLGELQHTRDVAHLNYLAQFNAMGDMATTIEHEIAQPLAAAMKFLAGTRRRHTAGTLDAAAFVTGLDGARQQLKRAGDIVRSLRNYVTHLEQSVQRVDLNELVADSSPLFELRAAEREVRIEVAASIDPVPVWCEGILTGQVILNLCYNAIEEMSEWPKAARLVRVETCQVGDWGVFRVIDRGKGLAHFPDGRVFDGAFTSKSSGHGIGLALSYQVIERQGGTITARENRPHGAIFEFRLPCRQGIADAHKNIPPSAERIAARG